MAPQAAAAGAVGPEIGRQEAWEGGRYLTQSLEPQPASRRERPAGVGIRGLARPRKPRENLLVALVKLHLVASVQARPAYIPLPWLPREPSAAADFTRWPLCRGPSR